MHLLRALPNPLTLAALATWGAVAMSMRASDQPALAWALLVAFIAAMLLQDVPALRGAHARNALLAVQGVAALALCFVEGRNGTAPVLLVILTAQVSMLHGLRAGTAALLLLAAGLYVTLRASGHGAPLTVTVIYAGFQAFAMLVGHYARSAERARDALALVNADLLATRALLADSARDAERLRVARELHDVAGHSLTALGMNLRVLADDPALAARAELQQARMLAGELLGQIRGVVTALRDGVGLDLATALRALAAPLPGTRLQLDIAPGVQVHRFDVADAVLRTVQEALTNAVRHAGARELQVSISRDGAGLRVRIADDGRLRGPLREGNGLTGMRERIEAVGGRLAFGATPRGGLLIDASLPA